MDWLKPNFLVTFEQLERLTIITPTVPTILKTKIYVSKQRIQPI